MSTPTHKLLWVNWIVSWAISKLWGADSDDIASAALDQIAKLMQDIHFLPASISLFLSEVPSLDKGQYVMPIELKNIHKELTDFLKTKRDLRQFTNTWMCIHGPIGNGKSEYVHHLKWLLWDKIDFVQLSVSSLRWSDNPSAELEKIYRDLETKYRDSDKYVVVFMDEFDQLFSTELESASKTSTKSHSNSSSSTQSTTTEKTATIDPVGVSLYNSLKTLLSGGLPSHRIFTIATTNKTIKEVPETLRRDDRLRSVNVENPFQHVCRDYTSVKSLNRDKDRAITRYNNVYGYIHHIIDICMAIENRSEQSIDTNTDFLRDLKRNCKSPTSKYFSLSVNRGLRMNETQSEEAKFIESQQNALRKLLTFLWYSEDIYKKFYILGWRTLLSSDSIPDIKNLLSINRSQIAALYKKNREALSEETFKKEIARLLFPQLRQDQG